MNRQEREALDAHITGHGGEDYWQTSDDVEIVALIAEIVEGTEVDYDGFATGEEHAERILNALRARGYDIVSSEPEKRYAPPF